MWRNASKYYVTLHQVPPASHASHRCSTHTRTCFTFLRRFHQLWKLSIDREKNCKTSLLVYHDVSSHRPEWTFYPVDVMLSSEEAILCVISPQGGDGWAHDEAWHVSGAWSGWSVAVVSRVMKPGTIWTLASASSVGSGHSDASQHPVSTRCITTL